MCPKPEYYLNDSSSNVTQIEPFLNDPFATLNSNVIHFAASLRIVPLGNIDCSDYCQESRNQAAPPPFTSVSFDAGTFPANFASMFANVAGNPSNNQNGQGRPAEDNHETQNPFVSTNFNSIFPPDVASVFMNMAGGAFQGNDSQSRSTEQNRENGTTHSFSNFSNMFMNMAGHGSQGQSPQAQPQGANNVGEDPGIGVGGTSFSFNFNNQTPEELNRTLRSMMGMFSGESQADPQNNADGRPASR